MLEEIYSCDKCKCKVKDKEELFDVSLELRGRKNLHYLGSRRMEICSICAEKIGVIKRVIKDNEIVSEKVPDIQDRLYDIFSDLVTEIVEEVQQ